MVYLSDNVECECRVNRMINFAAILERYYLSPHELFIVPNYVDLGDYGMTALSIVEVIKTSLLEVDISLQ